ncbi:MAG TPA: DUF559 domain-containing protein [Thermodesulfobacteriota bacterium]|nr:DUF559 domain-containing protein [Thermodesulfobacteriota bacterium]
MLEIEIDGVSHDFEEVYIKDMAREQRLESLGVHFLWFDNKEVKKDVNSVLQSMESWIL